MVSLLVIPLNSTHEGAVPILKFEKIESVKSSKSLSFFQNILKHHQGTTGINTSTTEPAAGESVLEIQRLEISQLKKSTCICQMKDSTIPTVVEKGEEDLNNNKNGSGSNNDHHAGAAAVSTREPTEDSTGVIATASISQSNLNLQDSSSNNIAETSIQAGTSNSTSNDDPQVSSPRSSFLSSPNAEKKDNANDNIFLKQEASQDPCTKRLYSSPDVPNRTRTPLSKSKSNGASELLISSPPRPPPQDRIIRSRKSSTEQEPVLSPESRLLSVSQDDEAFFAQAPPQQHAQQPPPRAPSPIAFHTTVPPPPPTVTSSNFLPSYLDEMGQFPPVSLEEDYYPTSTSSSQAGGGCGNGGGTSNYFSLGGGAFSWGTNAGGGGTTGNNNNSSANIAAAAGNPWNLVPSPTPASVDNFHVNFASLSNLQENPHHHQEDDPPSLWDTGTDGNFHPPPLNPYFGDMSTSSGVHHSHPPHLSNFNFPHPMPISIKEEEEEEQQQQQTNANSHMHRSSTTTSHLDGMIRSHGPPKKRSVGKTLDTVTQLRQAHQERQVKMEQSIKRRRKSRFGRGGNGGKLSRGSLPTRKQERQGGGYPESQEDEGEECWGGGGGGLLLEDEQELPHSSDEEYNISESSGGEEQEEEEDFYLEARTPRRGGARRGAGRPRRFRGACSDGAGGGRRSTTTGTVRRGGVRGPSGNGRERVIDHFQPTATPTLACVVVPQRRPKNKAPVKLCKCSKSKCLKLYCDCFQAGQICGPRCLCSNCHNTLDKSGPGGARTKAIESILMRRPDAFEFRTKKTGQGCSCKKNK